MNGVEIPITTWDVLGAVLSGMQMGIAIIWEAMPGWVLMLLVAWLVWRIFNPAPPARVGQWRRMK